MTGLRVLLLAVAACFVSAHTICFAEPQCPWMNSATAGGFLGGEVQTTVTGVNEDGDATCEFMRDASTTLRIAVHTMTHVAQDYPTYLAQCSASTIALKGIGNQAIQCMRNDGTPKGEELIVGRVRNRAFVITIKAQFISLPRTSSTKTRNPISDDSENIAEQVAGSMF